MEKFPKEVYYNITLLTVGIYIQTFNPLRYTAPAFVVRKSLAGHPICIGRERVQICIARADSA
jgi:hypothetical protein